MRKFSKDGRITIPANLRGRYNLFPRVKVKFIETKDGIKIITDNPEKLTTKEIKANIGFLGKGDNLLNALFEKKIFEREF